MGEVWVARHVVTGRVVALKILDRTHDTDIAERFRREAAVTAELGHPGIVEILDAGFGDGDHSFYIAMELLDGCTLEDRMADPLASPQEILGLIAATLVPLAAAHDRRVIHRDLKPANIFVMSAGPSPVKLLDFGIARTAAAKTMTQTGTAMGTPSYMCPEQALDARRVTSASDVWSLGVMMYEALSGERPFVGQTSHAVIVAACTEPHLSLTEITPGIDRKLSALIDRCLSKNPLERPQDAHALQHDLRPFLTEHPANSLVPQVRTSLRPRSLRPGGSVPGWAWGAVGVGGVLASVGGTLLGVGSGGAIPLVLGVGALALGGAAARRAVSASSPKVASVHPRPRLSKPSQSGPSLGSEAASVTLLAFADLAHPSSRRFARTLRDLADGYPEELRVVFKCLPGESDVSMLVAEVAHEAYAQNGNEAFWGLQELVHRGKRAPGVDQLEAHMESLRLQTHGLRHALRVGRHRPVIARDRETATVLSIDEGPVIFLEGVRVPDTHHATLVRAIERRLGRRRSSRPSHADTMPGRMQAPIGLRYVKVQWRGGKNARPDIQRSKSAALDRALIIHRRAAMPETDFGALARRFGDENHDLGVKPLLQFPRWARDPASRLGEGIVSEPLDTESGYVVLKRYV